MQLVVQKSVRILHATFDISVRIALVDPVVSQT